MFFKSYYAKAFAYITVKTTEIHGYSVAHLVNWQKKIGTTW